MSAESALSAGSPLRVGHRRTQLILSVDPCAPCAPEVSPTAPAFVAFFLEGCPPPHQAVQKFVTVTNCIAAAGYSPNALSSTWPPFQSAPIWAPSQSEATSNGTSMTPPFGSSSRDPECSSLVEASARPNRWSGNGSGHDSPSGLAAKRHRRQRSPRSCPKMVLEAGRGERTPSDLKRLAGKHYRGRLGLTTELSRCPLPRASNNPRARASPATD